MVVNSPFQQITNRSYLYFDRRRVFLHIQQTDYDAGLLHYLLMISKLYVNQQKTFGPADALSRLITSQKQESEDPIIATISLGEDIHQIQVVIKATLLSAEDIKRYT